MTPISLLRAILAAALAGLGTASSASALGVNPLSGVVTPAVQGGVPDPAAAAALGLPVRAREPYGDSFLYAAAQRPADAPPAAGTLASLAPLKWISFAGRRYFAFPIEAGAVGREASAAPSLAGFRLDAIHGDPPLARMAALQALGRVVYSTDAITKGCDTRAYLADDQLLIYSAFGSTGGYGGNNEFNADRLFEGDWQPGPAEPPPPAPLQEPSVLVLLAGAILVCVLVRRLA